MKFLFKSFSVILLLFVFIGTKAQMRQLYTDPIADNQIKKISFYSASEGYVAFSNWVGSTQDSGRTYIQKYITSTNVNFNGYSVNLTFGFVINGVKAFNQSNIIVYGHYGLIPAILISNNGGDNYTLVYHSQFNSLQLSTGITDMNFPQNGTIGYAIDADRVLKTSNQGLSWTAIYTSPNSCFDYIDAIDDNNVFVISDYNIDDIQYPNGRTFINNKIVKTNNGGSTWTLLNVPVGSIKFTSFITANKGWLQIGQDLNFTSNSGANWIKKNNTIAAPFNARKFKFINDSTGYALNSLFQTFKSIDSGKVWEPLSRDNNYNYLGYGHNDLFFFSANQLWAGGGHGFMEMSTNGGGNPLPKAIFAVDTTGVNATNNVSLINYSRMGYRYEWYVNNTMLSNNYSTSYTHNWSRLKDSVKLVVISGNQSDTLLIIQNFNLPNFAVLTGFVPTTGSIGTFITLSGTRLANVSAVNFGGVSASSFTIVNDTTITAILGNGSTGIVSVIDFHGTSSVAGFTYSSPSTSLPPVCSSLEPSFGPIGTSVTINGRNFGSSVADNLVYFGAVKAVVTATSSNAITCLVPPGASFEPVTVLNTTTNLLGQSSKPFNVTFNDSSNFTSHSFETAYQINFNNSVTGNSIPKFVSGKDIDNDGRPDIIASIGRSRVDSLIILRNTTTGNNFSFASGVSVGFTPWYGSGDFDIADMDNDGRLDIIGPTTSGIGNSPYKSILRNTSTPGNISFTTNFPLSQILPGGGAEADYILTDIDNDGRNDIITPYYGQGSVTTYNVVMVRNTSTPGYFSFAGRQTFQLSEGIAAIASGDIDGDGKKDVIAYTYSTSNLTLSHFSCLRNTSTTGSISFASSIDFTVPGFPQQNGTIHVADYDNDGKLDIVIVNNDYYCVYRNTSSLGTFSFAPVIYATIEGVGHISQGGFVSNLNGDVLPDIISGSYSYPHFTLFGNRSIPGSINTDNGITINGPEPYNTHACDFNLDGKMDILTSASNDHKISIYKNIIGAPVQFSVCENSGGTISADYTGTTYQWQKEISNNIFININNGSDFSGVQSGTLTFNNVPTTWNDFKFRCVIDNNKYSSVFLMKVKPILIPVITIDSVRISNCQSTTLTFTATVTAAGAINPGYMWLLNGNNTFNFTTTFSGSNLHNGDQVSFKYSFYDSCSNFHSYTSNVIIINGIPAPNTLVINSNTTNACNGSPTTFIATSNNTTAPSIYQWRVNGVSVSGVTSDTFTTSTLQNGDFVYCIQWYTPTCGIQSNSITIISNAVTPSVTISANNTLVCSGTSVTFTAVTNNGGSSPSYQWQLNGIPIGTNSNSFTTSTLNNGDQINCILTSNAYCVTSSTDVSNTIVVNVENPVTPTVSINTNNTTVCSGTAVIFTAVSNNGGPSPLYQWQVNGISAGSNSNLFTSSTLNTNDQIVCFLTSNATCVTIPEVASNMISMNVNASVLPAVSITTGTTNICTGTLASFNATSFNGGNSPLFQWKINGLNTGINSAAFSTNTMVNGDVVSVSLTSNASCASPIIVYSNDIQMTVNTSEPDIQIFGNTSINDNQSSLISTVLNDEGPTPSFQWQDSTATHTWATIAGANNSNINYSPTLSGDKLRCLLASSDACSLSVQDTSNVLEFSVSSRFSIPICYPNPVHSLLTIDNLRLSEGWQIINFSGADGRNIFSVNISGERKVIVNVLSLPAGYYFARMKNLFGREVKLKFIKL